MYTGCQIPSLVLPEGNLPLDDTRCHLPPEFLTKFDKVYKVQCFYMEMETVLEREITVKYAHSYIVLGILLCRILRMPPPVMQTHPLPMPVCKYEVLAGGPEGPPVFYATIGQMVYHKWSCDTETQGVFCMTVHTCIVDDGNGDKVELVDNKGYIPTLSSLRSL